MTLLVLILVLLLTLYCYGKRELGYWTQRGVKHDQPIPFLGNNAKGFLMLRSVSQICEDVYWKYPNEKIVGFYRGSSPELVVRDPALARRILINDFASFYPRGLLSTQPVIEPLLRNLFFADGDLWRLLRLRLTPAFTGGKLRGMFPLIVDRAERLQTRTSELAAAGRAIDARDLMARYTTDFIGTCGFGLDTDSLENEESAFRKLGSKIINVGFVALVVNVLKIMFPYTFRNFKIAGAVEKDIRKIVDEVQRHRNYEPSGRGDFIDLLLECKAKGTIVGESIERVTADGRPEVATHSKTENFRFFVHCATLEMDDDLVIAQVFIFFAAGFETSSSATSITLNELAHNPDIQTRVQAEVDRVLARHEKLTYDAVKEMTYLEWALKEGLRIFPPVGFLVRECARPYTIDGVAIDPGMKVLISLQAMHNDPQYFDEPDQFRPERFDPQQFASNHVYMPFGAGPRACIEKRLGLMQSLAGLTAILSRFTVRPAPSAPRRPKVDPTSPIVQNVGVPLVFVERNGVMS